MFCVGLAMASTVLAAPPPGSPGQLQQLNRANEAALRAIQRRSEAPRTIEPERPREKQLNRQQQADQRLLQERQRRQLLLLNHRARTSARPGLPNSLRGINLQRRFQQEQRIQLNRFRLQRGSPLR
jgi:hypothetical protein